MIHNALVVIPNRFNENQLCDVIDQTAKLLVQKNTVILFQVSKYKRITSAIKNYLHYGSSKVFKVRNRILYFYPLIFFPRITPLFERFNILINSYLLQFLILRKGTYAKKIFWLTYLDRLHIQNYFPSFIRIFDVIDNYEEATEQTKTHIDSVWNVNIRSSTIISSVSHTLRRKLLGFTKKQVHLVPQGFALEEFQNPKKSRITISKKTPVLGFVGAINERLDTHLLYPLIANNPQWQFVFVGPKEHDSHIGTKNTTRTFLKKIFLLPNAFWYPRQPKSTIPFIIKKFDICMIPYDVNLQSNRLSFPMKFFEYLYMGKPIVATPIHELKRYKRFVKTGDTPSSWEKHIHVLLDSPLSEALREEERTFAEKNSWKQKIEAISRILSR